jgi:polysaccharide biosynthesis transport protein
MRAVAAPLSIPAGEQGSSGQIDIGALFRAVLASKWLILIPTLLAFAGSLAAVNIIKPRFTSETRVLLETRESEYTRPGRDAARTSDLPFDAEAVGSQVQLVLSRDVAREMIKRFDLGSRAEFDPVVSGVDPVTKVMVLFGLTRNPASITPEERVLDSYYDKLKAFAVAKSRVLSVEFTSRDSELAAKLSAAIAEEYIRQLELAKKGVAQSASTWLGRSIADLRQRVADAEAKVEAFRTQAGLLAGTDNTTLTAQQLSELNTQYITARATQSDLASRARQIREAIGAGRLFETSDVVRDDVVRRLIETRSTLRAQIAQELQTLLPQHPRIRELNAQLSGLDEQVRAAAARAAAALENDARVAGRRVTAMQAEMDQLKRTASTANESDVQLRAHEREAKALREQLELFLTRFRDASTRDAENAVNADARIVSRALPSTSPSFPKKGPIVAIATVGMLMMMLFLVLTRELLSGRAYVETVPAAAPVSVAPPVMPMPEQEDDLRASLAQVRRAMAAPSPSRSTALAVPSATDDATVNEVSAPAVRRMAETAPPMRAERLMPRRRTPSMDIGAAVARLAGWQQGDHAQVCFVASLADAQGSAPVALDLSRQLSRHGRAILLDLNPGGEGFDEATGGQGALGFSDLMAGTASFGEVIHRDRTTRLHIVPAGQSVASLDDAADVIASALDALSLTYDHVVADVGVVGTAVLSLMPDGATACLVGGTDGRAEADVTARLPAGVSAIVVTSSRVVPEPQPT